MFVKKKKEYHAAAGEDGLYGSTGLICTTLPEAKYVPARGTAYIRVV
jgi:hypothetical protein